MKILVVDDEENVLFLVSSALELEGFEVETASSVREAKDVLHKGSVQLVVLDVMLPDSDGFSLLDHIRKKGPQIPVIFLSAQNSTENRVRGLTVGGDDFIGKPFALAELVARVRLRLNKTSELESRDLLSCGDLALEESTRKVTKSGSIQNLTRTEFELLRYLLMNKGVVLSREKILDHVWDYTFQGSSTVLDTFMSNLRKKIDNSEPQLIHTIRGVGYTIRDPQ